jgi:NADH-quinone oxidoreductase subunit M
VIGIVLTAAIFLRTLQRAFLGETPERWTGLPDLDRRELVALLPLLVLVVALGVYPRLALDLISSGSWLR